MPGPLFVRARWRRRLLTVLVVPVLLLGPLHGAAAADPASDGDDVESTDDLAGALATSELGLDVELSLEVISGPVRDEATGTYSVTYELVVTQPSDDTIEPMRLLGFTTTTSPSQETSVTVSAATSATSGAGDLGVGKRLIRPPEPDADGNFEVIFEVTAANNGEALLSDVQLTDDLGATFGPDAEVAITSVSVEGPVTVNSNYDGISDLDLLAGDDALAAGQQGVVTVAAKVKPTELGVYSSSADAAALSPTGESITAAMDGTVQVELEGKQTIEVELRLDGEPVETTPGVFEGRFNITVSNPGPFQVSNLQIHESFVSDAGTKFSVESVTTTSAGLKLDPRFDGSEHPDHLVEGGDLAVGESRELAVTVTTNRKIFSDLRQQVIASGDDPFGDTIAGGTLSALMIMPTVPPVAPATPTPTVKSNTVVVENGLMQADRVASSSSDGVDKKGSVDGRDGQRHQRSADVEVLGMIVERPDLVSAAEVDEETDEIGDEDEVAAGFESSNPTEPVNLPLLALATLALIGLLTGLTTVVANFRNNRRTAIVDEWFNGG